MKNSFLLAFICVIFFSCSVKKIPATAAAHPYEIIMDGQTKILKGLLNRSIIENDSSFKWFKINYNLGTVDMPAIAAFEKNASKFQMVIFGGTWCEDTQNLLPSFFRLVDKSNYPEKNITLIGVDRNKNTLGNLNNAFHITNVPTFIVMENGKEIARVVEYGKYGKIDRELGEIVSGL
ncbi:MAG: thioredoxin family protein [Chitinophagaceae bacterium]